VECGGGVLTKYSRLEDETSTSALTTRYTITRPSTLQPASLHADRGRSCPPGATPCLSATTTRMRSTTRPPASTKPRRHWAA
jgi:hypothetical protein